MAHGFALGGAGAPSIISVGIAPDDPQAILLQLSARAEGVQLTYGLGMQGALRDGWSMPSRTGVTLRRWALPAILSVHGGRA